MKVIPTKVHAIIDYIMGLLFIALPWLLGFARGGAETWIFVILGAGAIVYSLVTDYEYSATRKLSVSAHLIIDICAGILLAVSPWLFGFADFVFWPHVILGLIEVGTALFTRTTPEPTVARESHAGVRRPAADRSS